MTPFMLAAALFAAEPQKPVQTHDFSVQEIKGLIQKPAVDVTISRKPADFPRAFKVRENFDDKIVSSVDQL
ncbi:MAG: hypothetical protein JNK82_02480 [Myxococcaceae bacterium]|nr:hypothetical protein [Myxococcaceae bacterium]